MTMNEVIEYVDGVKPNVYAHEDKCRWMNTLDGIVAREVHQEEMKAYNLPNDAYDKQLLVPHPYDDIYALYVSAMIDFHNREYEEYNNTVLLFKERLEQYKAWYIRNHPCCNHTNFRNVMG